VKFHPLIFPGFYTSKSKVSGRGAILPISKGEFFLPGKLQRKIAERVSFSDPPGMRAVSVRVNDVVSVAGFVIPGTRVDVP